MRRFTDWGPACVVLLATMLALVFAPAMVQRVEFAQTSARVSFARQSLGEDDILVRMDLAIRRVAEAVEPSVAHIDVRMKSRGGSSGSSGSGWVFDTEGHVITNAHVLRGAESIRVQLSDGRLFAAELVGSDPLTDIAVLKLAESDGLIPAIRATGRHPRQGERVFAFGSPFGFKFSMSEGIISGLGREPAGAVATSSGYTNFIQTDAAVNPGNSGGPLVNVLGEVVGMNVAIATGSDTDGTTEGQSAGISFAIPLPVIESVATQLIQTGTVKRGFLGISLPRRGTNTERVGYNGFGVLVPAVSRGGPADLAGVQADDVITEIDGQEVTGIGVLRSLISTIQPGQSVKLRLWRDGEVLTVEPKLVEAGPEVVVGSSVLGELFRFGVQIGEGVGTRGELRPVVARVARGSAAAAAGFESGQRVLRVAGEEVRSINELTEWLAAAGLLQGTEVEITVAQVNLETQEFEERTLVVRALR